MANYFPSSTNVFVPEASATIVNYTRDPKKFKINELMTITPVDKPIGKIFRLKPEAQARVLNNPQAYDWPDGQPRPIQAENWQDFDTIEWLTKRRQVSHPIGYETEANAVWDVVATQQNVLANKIMMLRAKDLYTKLQDTASYATGHNDTATSLGGGLWSAGTSSNAYIQKSIQTAIEIIIRDTLGVVDPSQLVMVVGPTVARKIAAAAEVKDYLGQSVYAKDALNLDVWKNQYATFGCPPDLFGIKLVVDTLVTEDSAFGATSYSKSFVAGSNSAYIVARPGELVSYGGGAGFSTFHCFEYTKAAMLTEVIDVPLDRRRILTVTDEIQIREVAPESGYIITNLFS